MKRKATGYLPENQKKTKPKEANVVPSSVRLHLISTKTKREQEKSK